MKAKITMNIKSVTILTSLLLTLISPAALYAAETNDPFRTDDFPISTAPKPSPQPGTAAQVAPLSPAAQASPGSVHSASLKTTNQPSTPAVIHP